MKTKSKSNSKSNSESKATGAERQSVFLAYRNTLTGKNPQIQKRREIHRFVLRDWSSNKNRVGGCAIHQVVNILEDLSRDGVFVSEVQARKKFPSLYQLEPQQAGLEEQVNALYDLTEAQGEGNSLLKGPIGREEANNRQKHRHCHTPSNPIARSGETEHAVLTAQPIRLPYEVQHLILPKVQQVLEESCFGFVKKRLPFVLEENGWDCAAAGELTEWLRILRRHARRCLNAEAQTLLKEIAPAVARLRHTAVHRLNLTPKELMNLIQSARQLTEALQDDESVLALQHIYDRVDEHVKMMENKIQMVWQEVDTKLLDIQRQKVALAQTEKQLLLYRMQQNTDIPVSTAQAILESIIIPVTPGRPDVGAGKENTTGLDKVFVHTCDFVVHDDDIESDEDRLQAELD